MSPFGHRSGPFLHQHREEIERLGRQMYREAPAQQLAGPGVEGESAECDAQQLKGILILS